MEDAKGKTLRGTPEDVNVQRAHRSSRVSFLYLLTRLEIQGRNRRGTSFDRRTNRTLRMPDTFQSSHHLRFIDKRTRRVLLSFLPWQNGSKKLVLRLLFVFDSTRMNDCIHEEALESVHLHRNTTYGAHSLRRVPARGIHFFFYGKGLCALLPWIRPYQNRRYWRKSTRIWNVDGTKLKDVHRRSSTRRTSINRLKKLKKNAKMLGRKIIHLRRCT